MKTLLIIFANRLVNILLSIDCCLFSILTLGGAYTSESFSSAAWRAELNGKFYGKFRKVIDWLFGFLGQKDHCRVAFESAKYNLPPDMR